MTWAERFRQSSIWIMRSGNPEICNPVFCTSLKFNQCKKKYPTTFVGPLFSLVQDKRNIIHFHPWVNVTRFRWLMFLLCYSKQLWSSKFSALKFILLASEALRRLFFHLNHITAKFMHSFLIAPKFHKTEVNWGWMRKWHEAKWQEENNNAESLHCQ